MPSQNCGSVFRIDHPVESRLIENMHLENGLALEMFDKSRPIAGDRWLVSFEARIEVEVRREYFRNQHKADVSFEDIRAAVGERVLYCYETVRNFIGKTEKDDIFKELKKRFLNTNIGYLSGPDFPPRLILRKYKEALYQRRSRW